ncbi:glycosyltransferase [Archangium primigenium]|uniref:glycosyltransferase n=1 Tax=[Archangium] primigenium TaxID=2792470 RepID=UPI001957A95F|nr:glycosyltransferase [Archangium primigenium]MBM7114805.1 glycosyltransferase family 1 protein [Archangium primigenium]
MRILIAANGSRGDVQPMLALAWALRERGHEAVLASNPRFASEAHAFGLPFVSVGQDLQRIMEDHRDAFSGQHSMGSVRRMQHAMTEEVRQQFQHLVPLARDFDRVVGGGFVLAARTAAEAAGRPFSFVVYTPQVFPSAHHPPTLLHLTRAPRWFARMAWWGMGQAYNLSLRRVLNEQRQLLGLAPVKDVLRYFFSLEHTWVAAEPELYPMPPDVAVPQVGAFCLPDARPFPEELERFLAAGPPPVYVGFGSMPDAAPERTTRIIAEAARRAGCRVVLSSGGAGLGGKGLGPDLLPVGALSHWKLFPRMAGIVHHAGAGTTAAAARAGVPQVAVPHVFDQFMLAHRVVRANLGVSLTRRQLTVARLAAALARIRQDGAIRASAARTGERLRQHNALETFIQHLTKT